MNSIKKALWGAIIGGIVIVIIVWILRVIYPAKSFEHMTSATKPTKKETTSDDNSNRISDLDSKLVFFNHSAYDKISVDPEPNIHGIEYEDLPPISLMELSPIAGKINYINTTAGIDRLD